MTSTNTIVILDTPVEGRPEQYEQRFTLSLLGHGLPLVRRPVAMTPPEGTVALIDSNPRGGLPSRKWATFKGGKWVGKTFEPTHWTVLDHAQRTGLNREGSSHGS